VVRANAALRLTVLSPTAVSRPVRGLRNADKLIAKRYSG